MKAQIAIWLALALSYASGYGSRMASRGIMQHLHVYTPRNSRPTRLYSVSSFALRARDVDEDMVDEATSGAYTQKQILRAEAESPFRKVRTFLFAGLLAAAALGTLVTATSILAGKTDDSLYQNLAINVGGILGLALLLKNDAAAEQKQLKRISQGGKLANLRVQLSSFSGQLEETQIMKLADFRQQRGFSRNLIVIIGPKEAVEQSIKTSLPLSKALVTNQCLLIPLILDASTMQLSALTASSVTAAAQAHVGLPVGLVGWTDVMGQELQMALKQNADAMEKGITILVKMNGKVGKRKMGVPLFEENDSSGTDGGFNVARVGELFF